MLKRGVLFIVLVATLLWAQVAQATHIRAGEITIERKNCQSLTFVFYVTGYVDLIGGQVLFGGGTLDFGDGTAPIEFIRDDERVEIILDEVDLGGGNGVGVTRFRIEHTYSSAGNFIVTYNEPNRNEHILNMDKIQRGFSWNDNTPSLFFKSYVTCTNNKIISITACNS